MPGSWACSSGLKGSEKADAPIVWVQTPGLSPSTLAPFLPSQGRSLSSRPLPVGTPLPRPAESQLLSPACQASLKFHLFLGLLGPPPPPGPGTLSGPPGLPRTVVCAPDVSGPPAWPGILVRVVRPTPAQRRHSRSAPGAGERHYWGVWGHLACSALSQDQGQGQAW